LPRGAGRDLACGHHLVHGVLAAMLVDVLYTMKHPQIKLYDSGAKKTIEQRCQGAPRPLRHDATHDFQRLIRRATNVNRTVSKGRKTACSIGSLVLDRPVRPTIEKTWRVERGLDCAEQRAHDTRVTSLGLGKYARRGEFCTLMNAAANVRMVSIESRRSGMRRLKNQVSHRKPTLQILVFKLQCGER